MSGELFDNDPRAQRPAPPAAPPRRSRALVITGVVLVIGFFGLTTFSTFFTDRMWYAAIGYPQVFSTLFWTRTGLFLVFAAVMALVVGLNMFLAFRLRPLFRPNSPEQAGLDRYREAVTPIRIWLLAGVSLLLGLFAGASAAGQWRQYLLWRNGTEFGSTDEYFNKDIGFYVFDLPWIHYLIDSAMAFTVVALLMAALVHYLYGGIRLQVAARPAVGCGPGAAVGPARAVRPRQGGRLLVRPLRPGARGRPADHRHHLHRRPRRPAGQEHPGGHRDHLRDPVLPQRLAPHLDAAVARSRPPRAVGRPARPDLARHRPAVPGRPDRGGQGSAVHQGEHRRDQSGVRPGGRQRRGLHQ